ncbi:MAG: NADH-quinone oxidoreductase subunit NuoH [bacterium]|nr:NADH-quinone oxidoreductase subunit NuoH [bacterium]
MATVSTTQTERRIPRWLIITGVVALVGIVLLGLLIANIDSVVAGVEGFLNNTLFNANRINPNTAIDCRSNAGCSIIHSIIYSLLFIFVILTGFAYTTLLERKFIAWFQQRSGPNRVGPGGLLQPLADAIKLIFKEDIMPNGADKWVYRAAPLLKSIPALILLAVVPLGPDLLIPWFDGNVYRVPMGLVDLNVGVLWLLAITSIGTYGVVLAGWASNNKYAMLGGLRASAQMLSYELSLGLTMAIPIIIVGSMSLGDIIREQTYFHQWFIFQNPLAAGILFIALLAEISRAPFDLPEAEQELTQGFMTEYSGMKFAQFMMAEYLGMIGISVIIATLYLGGYQDGFGLVDSLPILAPLVIIGKVVLLLIFMVWIRATLPRIRYDRLMSLGWKIMLPLALVSVAWTSVSVLIADSLGGTTAYAIIAGVVFVIVVAGGVVLLRGDRETETQDRLEDDPVVTGERRGLGWMGLQVLGGILAIPFGLFNGTIALLERVANAVPERKPETPPTASSDTTAIVPTHEPSAD